MRKPAPPLPRHNTAKAQLLASAAGKRTKALHEQGRYQEALDICLQVVRAHPGMANAWADAAANCVKLERWQDAIRYGQTALARGGNSLSLYDGLAHAYSSLEQWDKVRRYGLQALNIRAQRFNAEPVLPLPEPGAMPPPSAQTREHNIIAFSLFGNQAKYCETAVLNVLDQPGIYPHWVCRFYVDGSVPEGIIDRLRAGGGQVVAVDGPAAQWPGPMWRFLALDDPLMHRVLFRDADSLISQREAAAVEQWIASGKRFHMMRDAGSHTELMLAGLWGVVCGSLPPLQQLMDRFMSAPLESRHFADQFFLRRYVWPYARASLMQHDSIFGFMDAVPFPDGAAPHNFHVGCMDSRPFFNAKSNVPNGTEVVWELHWIEPGADGPACEEFVCAYPAIVNDGEINVNIPERYARRLQQGTARVRLAPR